MAAQRSVSGEVGLFAEHFEAIVANIEQAIQGKAEPIRLALVCLLAEGHLLIEDVPGVGKTSMAKALAGRTAWMTGLRRDESPTRAQVPIVGYDVGRGLVKVNPIATWTEADVASYADDRALPEHPLKEKGYLSIGCWPCTRPVGDGEDARAGRWAGLDKLECGLHG